MGRTLKVDLTGKRIREEKLDEDFYKMWLGGYRLGVRIIYSDITPKTHPLGQGNILGLTVGLLSGAMTPLGSGSSGPPLQVHPKTGGEDRSHNKRSKHLNRLFVRLA